MSNHPKVAIFWDYENCSPPSNSSGLGYQIVNNMSRITRLFGSVTTFRAYLDISAQSSKSVALRSELQSSGVSMIDCPHNGRKDVVDKMLLVDMLAFAVDHPVPATVILITGDRDYAYAVSTLKLRKYQVILIVPSSPHTSPSLESQASLVIDWGAAVLRTRTDVTNSTQAVRQPSLDLDANLVTKLLRELQYSPLDDPDAALHTYSTTFPDTPKLTTYRHCKNMGSFDDALEVAPNPTSPSKSRSGPTPGGLPIPKTPSRSRRASVSTGSTRARSTTIVAQSPPEMEHDSPAKDPSPSKSVPNVTDSVGPAKRSPVLPSLDTLELPLLDSCPPSSIIIRSPLEPSQSMGDVPVSEQPGLSSPHRLNCLASSFVITKPLFGVPSSCTSQSHTTVKPTSPIVGPTKTLPETVSSVCETPQIKDIRVPKEIERPTGSSTEDSDTDSGRSIPHLIQSEKRAHPKSNYFPYVAPPITCSPSNRNVGLIDAPAVTPKGVTDRDNSQFAASSRASTTLGHSTPGGLGSVLSSSALPSTPLPAMASHESGRLQTWAMFKPLVHLLLAARESGIFRPSRSTVALALVQSDKQVYQRAGVSKFRDYTALAEQAGIIELGGLGASAWIMLHPNWCGVDGTTTQSPTSSSPEVTQSPLVTNPKTPPMERTAIFQSPTLTSSSLNSTSSTDRQDGAFQGFIPVQFQPLIDVLIGLRAEGSHQTLRSVVGQLLSQDVYARAGVSGFKEYVNQASEAQLVQFGGVGGHAWMRLHTGLRPRPFFTYE
ncbi:hypothetical protein JVT61DRAFT_2052 [Boletus reticuloceps]|uniref:NYN domain-containing protein n=1 Tax=Boletus reticuloceps TaxID=495285 RepID=A0A8I3A8R2_9AGAM|nr:hypothetical protein JVT61DRAFT_2052 [Boletus reticuloceps]